jgi:DNA-binding transcriptional regulator YiaG
MPSIAAVLRQEMMRLARKETRTQIETLRKSNAQYRRDIAQLKRQTAELTRQVAFLEKQEKKRTARPAAGADAEGKRFSARGLKTHRRKLGLSAAEYSKLVGVTAQTIYNWERGAARPRREQLAALVAVRDLGKREALKRIELLEG